MKSNPKTMEPFKMIFGIHARGKPPSAPRLAQAWLVLAALMLLAPCHGFGAEHTLFVVTGPHQDLAYHCTYRQSMVAGKPPGWIEGYVKQLRDHIEMIERHPDARFCMGNTYNTKDFIERHGEFLLRLRRLVGEGKIDTPAQWVGWEPSWYSGELLVRGTVCPKWWAMDVLGYEPRWAQLNDVPSFPLPSSIRRSWPRPGWTCCRFMISTGSSSRPPRTRFC